MLKVCLIVPCYNESERLDQQSFLSFVKDYSNIHFLFVNDGSKDDTESLINSLATEHPNIKAVSVPQNGGKAEAVRFGVHYLLESNVNEFDFVGFYDCDQATPLSEVVTSVQYLQTHTHFRMLMGMRLKRLGSKVNRDIKRHYLGRVFATFVSLTLSLPTYDTQCGYKLLHRDLLKVAFAEQFSSSWFFDVEILFRLKNKFGEDFVNTKVYEYPLFGWEEVGDSRIKLKDYLTAPFELLKIRRKYH